MGPCDQLGLDISDEPAALQVPVASPLNFVICEPCCKLQQLWSSEAVPVGERYMTAMYFAITADSLEVRGLCRHVCAEGMA